MNKIRSFKQAYEFLVTTVPKTSVTTFKGTRGFQKSRMWMESLGNPQDVHPAIHIAGTSGKGTVSHLIAAILEAHGKKTALLVSPHAYNIRERILIRFRMLSERTFTDTLNLLMPSYKKMQRAGSPPSYFETLFAIGFLAASKRKIDYCIVETGMGGKLDTSNTISRKDKVCVITPIGFDHTHILGNTLTEIASQKIGIAHKNQRVFSAPQAKEAMEAIKLGCKKVKAKLTVINPSRALKKYGITNLPKLNNQLYGKHNLSNLSLAIESVKYVATRDGWTLKSSLIRQAIKTFHIPGRFEIIRTAKGQEFIFDGAHNEQKFTALADVVKQRYGNKKIGIVFATSKEAPASKLKIIKRIANHIILTQYHSRELDILRPQPDLMPFANGDNIIYLPKAKSVISHIQSSKIKYWVVTGSFYILKEIKDLLQREESH